MTFSIILPTIHRASLKEAINSVFRQTYKDWQLIIVSDGTNLELPGTHAFGVDIDIMDAYDKITYITLFPSAADSGATPRNIGIAASWGDWLAFIDDDDLWEENCLEIFNKLITENPEINMIRTSGIPMYLKHRHPRSSEKVIKLGAPNHDDIMTVGISFTRELFKKTNGWTSDINKHDLILWNEMLKIGGKSAISNEITFKYARY